MLSTSASGGNTDPSATVPLTDGELATSTWTKTVEYIDKELALKRSQLELPTCKNKQGTALRAGIIALERMKRELAPGPIKPKYIERKRKL